MCTCDDCSSQPIEKKWVERWMNLAKYTAQNSKDRSRHVGAVIVKGDVDISKGWNGFARGVNEDIDARHERPEKYLWTEHAERNAIFNAARNGAATKGCTIYSTLYPCADCARAIVQSGIIRVVTVEPDWNDSTYSHSFFVAKQTFEEAKIEVIFV